MEVGKAYMDGCSEVALSAVCMSVLDRMPVQDGLAVRKYLVEGSTSVYFRASRTFEVRGSSSAKTLRATRKSCMMGA